MRKSTFILFFFLISGSALTAQDYPPDPEPGMCYIRCKKELVEKKVKHIVVPEYKEFKVVGAIYETVTEQVVITPASKRYEYVPAVYRDVIDTFLVEDPIHKITLVPVKTIDTFDVIEIQPAYAQFESRPGVANCKSKNPRDCDVICYVVHEAVKKEIPVKKIVASPTYVQQLQRGKFKTIKRKELVSAATVKEFDIPAETITIQKRALVKDETIDSIPVGAVYREEVNLVRDEASGGTESDYEWKKIECTLTELNVLPIYYNLNSALLTAAAKRVIDEKLYKLMTEMNYVRIEISSHTDARASDDFNLDLSKRRAEAVVDYLVSKGIKKTRLEYHGYGETQLVNNCANGVNCPEEKHAKNRRTEFRVLPY